MIDIFMVGWESFLPITPAEEFLFNSFQEGL